MTRELHIVGFQVGRETYGVSITSLHEIVRVPEITAAPSRRNRILVVEHNARLSGLIVDSASEVLKIPAEDVEPAPHEFQEGGLNCVTGLAKYKGRLIVLLDMAKLLDYSGLHGKKAAEESKLVAADSKTKSAAATK
jgi:purine-binding chemotaxis protein CheW